MSSPVTVCDGGFAGATRYNTQRKVFKNPRGLGYYYALIQTSWLGLNKLKVFRSSDGSSWEVDEEQLNWQIGIGTASWWWEEDPTNSQLIVYIVYDDGDGVLYFRRATIADNSSDMVLGAQRQVIAGIERTKPVVVRAKDGYLWIIYDRKIVTAATHLYVDGFTIAGTITWTRVGTSPYLDAIDYPVNYVHNTAKDDETVGEGIREFTFEDMPEYPITESYVDLYCKGDGDDTIWVFLWDGSSWVGVGIITPTTSWSWQSLRIDGYGFGTYDKINGAKLWLVKKTSKKANVIEVDCAKLRVITTNARFVGAMITTQPIEDFADPSNPTFSMEQVIWENDTDAYEMYPTIHPFDSLASADVLIANYYKGANLAERTIGLVCSWDGTTLTKGTVYTNVNQGTFGDEIISLVTDDANDEGHVFKKITGLGLSNREYRFVDGSGWVASSGTVIADYNFLQAVVSIDKSVSPEEIYMIITYEDSSSYEIKWNKNPIGGTWSETNVKTITDPLDEKLAWFSCNHQAVDGKVQLIYTTQTSYKVRFVEVSVAVLKIQYSNGLVCVSVG